MPIFISYSHVDKSFATRLATQLVRHKASVWIDQWELHVGDSLIQRIEEAVQGSTCMLVVLSKASVASAWCRQELSSGLLRELEEKRVVVFPVLIEDCEIPLFLRGKLYADFRSDFDAGFKSVLEAVSRFTSETLGRVDNPQWYTDWSEEWGLLDGRFILHLTLVQHTKTQPYTVLTEIKILANQLATQRYFAFAEEGLDWVLRSRIIESLGKHDKALSVLLEDETRKTIKFDLGDWDAGFGYDVLITSRRLGTDTGRDIWVDLTGQLREIREAVRHVRRSLTKEETEKLAKLGALLEAE